MQLLWRLFTHRTVIVLHRWQAKILNYLVGLSCQITKVWSESRPIKLPSLQNVRKRPNDETGFQ